MYRGSYLIKGVFWRVALALRSSIDGNIPLPKVILLDRANGVDRSHVGFDTKNFQTQTGSFLDHLVCMIGVLRRHGVRLPFDITGDVLSGWLVTGLVGVD